MAQGTVKWFNTQKGYGFINPDEGDNDVFVHITAVQNSGLNGLNEGQKVTYELEEQRNGKMAAVGLGLVDYPRALLDEPQSVKPPCSDNGRQVKTVAIFNDWCTHSH